MAEPSKQSNPVLDRLTDLGINLALFGFLWLAYTVGRRTTSNDLGTATRNALRLLDVQAAVGIPQESAMQAAALAHPLVIRGANEYYLWVHFPLTLSFLTYAWWAHRIPFKRVRLSMIGVTAAALAIHVLFPLAPPRLMTSQGFVDTGMVFGPSPYEWAFASATNQIAAMPSMHVGWSILIALGVVTMSKSAWRFLVLAHPAITLFVVVATANHYWSDGIVAAMLVAVFWMIAVRCYTKPAPQTAGSASSEEAKLRPGAILGM